MRVRGTATILLVATVAAACAQGGGDERAREFRGAKLEVRAAALEPRTVYAGKPSLPPLATAEDPFAYDETAPLNQTETVIETTATYTTTAVTYQTYDGSVPGLLYTPVGPGPYRCVLHAHGVTSHKDGAYGLRDLLVPGGYALFVIDARFHGERDNSTRFSEIQHFPGLARELFQGNVVDLRRALDYLEQRPDCVPGKLGFVGTSMGGWIGAALAGADERVQAPVLLFSGADYRLWFTTGHPGVVGIFYEYGNPASLEATLAALDPLDPVKWVGKIAPRPVLMVHGDADDAVPPATGQVLFDAALDPKTILWYPGGHGPIGEHGQQVEFTLVGWLDQYLKT